MTSADQGKIMIKWLFRLSVSIGVVGMLLGMAMGMTQNFLLAPAHAHFLLLGYVAMFLSALYYRTVPEAATNPLAPVQAIFSIVGAILFPIGIACVRLGDRHRFMPVLVAGWLTVLTGMLLFAVIVYRSTGSTAAQLTKEYVAGRRSEVPGSVSCETANPVKM
jgi:vacuolar-type H+-ATPase subunit I/STV1